jgi:hypothetical protein
MARPEDSPPGETFGNNAHLIERSLIMHITRTFGKSLASVSGLSSVFCCLLLVGLVFGFPIVARAHLPPIQDADDAVFSATQVVLVAHLKDDQYSVVETFLGTLKPGDTVTLPGFKLVTFNKMHGDAQPVKVDERTRILLFLRPDEKDASKLVVTGYGFDYFYRDADKIAELREIANGAIAYKRKWETAIAIQEPQRRVEKLLPYVLKSPPSCWKLTLVELAKLNPLPGDYIAEHLESYPSADRARLMQRSGQLPSARLHAAGVDQGCLWRGLLWIGRNR